MIFNKEYDMSLWLMLVANSRNRRKIAEFVNEYPNELIYRLRDSLNKYTEYLNKNLFIMDCELTGFTGSVVINDISYWYCIDVNDGVLELGRTTDMGYNQFDIFQLSLSQFSIDVYDSMKCIKENYLGTVTSSFVKRENDGDKGIIDLFFTQFNVIKLPFERLLVKSAINDKSKYFSVSFDMINETYSKDELKTNDDLNCLIRRRKNKNFK